MLTSWLRFSCVNTANCILSMEDRSAKTPMGRVRRRTSRKRRSMTLVVRAALRQPFEQYLAKAQGLAADPSPEGFGPQGD